MSHFNTNIFVRRGGIWILSQTPRNSLKYQQASPPNSSFSVHFYGCDNEYHCQFNNLAAVSYGNKPFFVQTVTLPFTNLDPCIFSNFSESEVLKSSVFNSQLSRQQLFWFHLLSVALPSHQGQVIINVTVESEVIFSRAISQCVKMSEEGRVFFDSDAGGWVFF